MTLDYLSKINPPPTPRPGFWVCIIAVISGLLGFGCWCLIDYMDVNAPLSAQNFYPLWLLPPVIVIAWPAIQFRNMEDQRRFGLIMTALLGATILTSILILGVGPLFHQAIGGNAWRPPPMPRPPRH